MFPEEKEARQQKAINMINHKLAELAAPEGTVKLWVDQRGALHETSSKSDWILEMVLPCTGTEMDKVLRMVLCIVNDLVWIKEEQG